MSDARALFSLALVLAVVGLATMAISAEVGSTSSKFVLSFVSGACWFAAVFMVSLARIARHR